MLIIKGVTLAVSHYLSAPNPLFYTYFVMLELVLHYTLGPHLSFVGWLQLALPVAGCQEETERQEEEKGIPFFSVSFLSPFSCLPVHFLLL